MIDSHGILSASTVFCVRIRGEKVNYYKKMSMKITQQLQHVNMEIKIKNT